MYKNKTRVTSRVAVAVALSLGITVGAVGVASASPVVQHHSVHGGHGWMQSPTRVEGMVSSYTAGLSISIVSKGSTTPEVYALTSATVINGLAIGVTLASPDKVDLRLSSTTPLTVRSITLDAPRATKVEGIVSAYTAGTSIVITPKGSTTATTYALTSATVINGLAIGVTLASPTNVDLVLSPSTPTTVTSIFVDSNAKGKDCGHGSHSSNKSGSNHGAVNSHRSHRFGSSQHGHGRR
jgi:hypothetical protein